MLGSATRLREFTCMLPTSKYITPMLYNTRNANIKGISYSDDRLVSLDSRRRWISMRSQISCDSFSAFAKFPGMDGYMHL